MSAHLSGAAIAAESANLFEHRKHGSIFADRPPNDPTDPGPQNAALAQQFPSALTPPKTDVGGLPMLWASFSNSPKRIQDGGWAREVTVEDFAVSKEIAGVNMRLSAGGIRELHWHQAAEWAIMTYGACRVTVLDTEGRPYVADVGAGDIWYFPPGAPHSLQGLGPDGCEFVICFDDGGANEFNTLLLSDWLAHTPPDVLAKNFGVPAAALAGIPKHDLWIFQGEVPGDLAADRDYIGNGAEMSPYPFVFPLGSTPPLKENASGSIRVADSTNFKVSTNIASALITVPPGGIRELHWHPNADEWQYYLRGRARMTVFNTGPHARTTEFSAGDVGYVPRNYGHYVENIGDTDMVFVGVFRSPRYQEVSLSNWLTRTPARLVAQHMNVDDETIAAWPRNAPGIMPKS